MLSNKNLCVLTNTIGAVESGGQVYGKRNYSAYAGPYTNSSLEKTITLGWAQNYGAEAYKLVLMIYTMDPKAFDKIDPTGKIKAMINGEHDWVAEEWKPSTYQRYILIALIDSPVGHAAQDKLFAELMSSYISDCERKYTTKVKPVMMYCEIRHLGGKKAADRIFDRCNGDFSLDNIMTALKKDQSDKSSNNQVGDQKFWSRHVKCREFIEKYAIEDEAKMKENKPMGTVYSNGVSLITDFSKYYGKISNSGKGETGWVNQKPGDQTGAEWNIRSWYNRPWTHILRYPDRTVANLIATLGILAAKNDKIGYDQAARSTYFEHLKASEWNPSKISVRCSDDCSCGVMTNIYASGKILGIKKFCTVYPGNVYSGNIRSYLSKMGFQTLTDNKYLSGVDYLLPGDILLCEEHHVATNLTEGKKATSAQTTPKERTLHEEQQWIGECTAISLNVRKWAGKDNPNIKSWPILSKGNRVGVCDTIKATDGSDWYYIVIDNSTLEKPVHGFVSAQFIRKV